MLENFDFQYGNSFNFCHRQIKAVYGTPGCEMNRKLGVVFFFKVALQKKCRDQSKSIFTKPLLGLVHVSVLIPSLTCRMTSNLKRINSRNDFLMTFLYVKKRHLLLKNGLNITKKLMFCH